MEVGSTDAPGQACGTGVAESLGGHADTRSRGEAHPGDVEGAGGAPEGDLEKQCLILEEPGLPQALPGGQLEVGTCDRGNDCSDPAAKGTHRSVLSPQGLLDLRSTLSPTK